MADYQSTHTGQQIDDAIEEIIHGNIGQAAEDAKQAAQQSAQSAKQSGDFATASAGSAKTSQSYAVGGTGSRVGEDTDNAKHYATQASEATKHAPKITLGTWWIWDATQGDYTNTGVEATGPQGTPGKDGTSIYIEDTYPTLEALRQAIPSGDKSMYYVRADSNCYIYSEQMNDWVSVGQLRGGVNSVNGKVGIVELTAEDVQAVPQKKIFAERTITVQGAELPSFIKNLPRFLTESYTIMVEGNVEGDIMIRDFSGGFITIEQANFNTFPLCVHNRTRIQFVDCNLSQKVESSSAGFFTDNSALEFLNCTFDLSLGKYAGLQFVNSKLFFSGGSLNKARSYAVIATDSTICAFVNVASSGNTNGFQIKNGSLVMLGNNTDKTLGGYANYINGGAILNADGTIG